MTDRAKAFTYGVLIAFVVSLTLLVIDSPSGADLLIAIGCGVIGGLAWYRWEMRR
jgi:hypothetical protein